ncbi:4a-hydroxytetrahydrobiopterin dehydratase [Candidatus Kaiserbacteria bacterium]|nr:4a-hydroxytetrahydrobiopterin dehydratase [Candidatus Kaiserbacteria bacterium]
MAVTDLVQKKCVACEAGMSAFTRAEAEALMAQVPGWELDADARSISKTFKFKDFAQALEFVNNVGAIAESEGHHPDIEFGWGKAKISLTTHAIKGLSENDFILAAKIDKIA